MMLDKTKSVDQATHWLLTEFRNGAFLRQEFPMLSEWGVNDYGLAVHSMGLNYLSALGRQAGFWSVTEFPIIPTNDFELSRRIRGDVLWFDKKNAKVVLLGEFERYVPQSGKRSVLWEKAENLVIAHHQLGNEPRILLLTLWTVTGVPIMNLGEFITHVRAGFRDEQGNPIPSLPSSVQFLVVTFIFRKSEKGLILGEVQM